jgi:hypothetical protein
MRANGDIKPLVFGGAELPKALPRYIPAAAILTE